MLISGSFFSHNPKEAINKYDKTNIDYIHVDVADGKFVERKSFTLSDIEKFSTYTSKPMDVHLMVKNPEKYIDSLSMLNTEYITFHFEAVKTPMSVINHIKENGIKAGISIKPGTNVSDIFSLLPYLDLVLIMSVEPGLSGQKFMESVLYKIEVLRKEIDQRGYKTLISVDGGINSETYPLVKEKGVDMVISESYLLDGDTSSKVNEFKLG